MHDAVDLEVKRLMNLQGMSYAQGFRLNTLAGRFRTYSDLWQRQLRSIEHGRKQVYGVHAEPKTKDRVEIAISSEGDRESIDVLFQAFCRAQEKTGNEAPIDPSRFEELVTTKLRDLKTQKDCLEVIFVVSEENGQVQLKTRTGK
jgi:hypothetical protein